jgi:signal transduction histidine kinase
VSNVLLNALQATGGGGRVRIGARRAEGTEGAEGAGGAVEIAVDDGGPGVPEERRESVFRDGYTTRPGGSGFGLAYVRRLVEDELHGKVWCERSDLGGARFVMAIPEIKAAR